MPHPPPFFSVITTTHLRAPLLERALQSLRQQSFQDFEMIVVADALDAGTARVCAELLRAQDVFVKRNGAPGPAESRNLGMDMARGEWVLFLDDDDSFQPQHLQTLHRRITQPASEVEHAARVLYSDFEVLTEDRTQQPLAPLSRAPVNLKAHAVANLHVKNFIPNNALAFHRLVLEGCRVDPHLQSLEDWDFLLSVCAKATPCHYEGGGAVVHKDYVNTGTRRGTQTAANDSTVVVDFLHIYRRWRAPSDEIRRQRQALLQTAGLALPVEWF